MTDIENLKREVESLLFSSGKTMSLEELSKLSKESDLEQIKTALNSLKTELEEKQSSLIILEENNSWKLAVREKYLLLISKLGIKTELTKSITETLAVVAYKAPALQSQIIHIRTNKAYNHLDELEQMGYITREKKGRTKLIKLSQRFFDYFDLPPEKLKEKFHTVQQMEAEIKEIEGQRKAIEKHNENIAVEADLHNKLDWVFG